MRRLLVIALVACSTPKQQPAPPPKPSLCPKVADHIVSLMTSAQKYPPEATDPFRNVVDQRCTTDRWGNEAQQCLLAITALDQGERCQAMLTKPQVEAFHRESEAALGQLHSQMHDDPQVPTKPPQ